jgi:hypothetical protein
MVRSWVVVETLKPCCRNSSVSALGSCQSMRSSGMLAPVTSLTAAVRMVMSLSSGPGSQVVRRIRPGRSVMRSGPVRRSPLQVGGEDHGEVGEQYVGRAAGQWNGRGRAVDDGDVRAPTDSWITSRRRAAGSTAVTRAPRSAARSATLPVPAPIPRHLAVHRLTTTERQIHPLAGAWR